MWTTALYSYRHTPSHTDLSPKAPLSSSWGTKMVIENDKSNSNILMKAILSPHIFVKGGGEKVKTSYTIFYRIPQIVKKDTIKEIIMHLLWISS